MSDYASVIRPGDGARINDSMVHKIDTAALPGGGLAVIEGVLPPGYFVVPHTHESEDEVSYILQGEVTFEIGNDVVVATAGSCVLKPRGVSHAFWNAGEVTARVMELHSPGGFERFYDDMEKVFGDPESDEEAKLANFRATAAAYGVVHHVERTPELRARHGLPG